MEENPDRPPVVTEMALTLYKNAVNEWQQKSKLFI